MHKLLIVDDEWMIREGLEKTVPWADWNIKVAGTAKNGLEALEKLQQQPVDILLTDIRMPGMDGLELIERCTQDFPTLKIVLLTGHNEFSYAQKALRLGAFDFLLKPTDVEELEKTMCEVTAVLDAKQAETDELLSILIGSILEHPTEEKFKKLEAHLEIAPAYGIIIIQPQEAAPAFDWPNALLIDGNKTGAVYLFYGIEGDAYWDKLLNELKEEMISSGFNGTIHAGPLALQIEQLRNSYLQAGTASTEVYKDPHFAFYRHVEESHDGAIQQALAYVTQNLHKPLSQSEIAKNHHMSNSNFSKVFKQYTGMNFVDFITERRLDKAKELLRSTNLKTYEIAEHAGFAESRYFSQLFKKKVGCTPKEYREKNGRLTTG